PPVPTLFAYTTLFRSQQHPFCCVRPRKTVDPLPMRPRPVPPVVVQATTQEKLPQTMPAPLQILAGIVARATQITDGFFFGCRRRSEEHMSELQSRSDI